MATFCPEIEQIKDPSTKQAIARKILEGLHEKLFDFVDLVVAPVLVGGKDTATLIDGKSLMSENELSKLGVMKLVECKVLKDSYLRLRYEIVK